MLRLLISAPEITIENILLVTFTEKATSDLKLRIRQKIQQHVDETSEISDAEGKKLQDALDGFDNAAIFTIHAFAIPSCGNFPLKPETSSTRNSWMTVP